MSTVKIFKKQDMVSGEINNHILITYYERFTEEVISECLKDEIRAGIKQYVSTDPDVQKQIKDAIELACKALPLDVIADTVKKNVLEAMAGKEQNEGTKSSTSVVSQ